MFNINLMGHIFFLVLSLVVTCYQSKDRKQAVINSTLSLGEHWLNRVKGFSKVRCINDFLSVVCIFCMTKHCFCKLLMYIRITYLPMYITVWTNLGIQAHFGRSIRRRSSLLVRRIVDRLARNFTYVHTEDMWHSPHWETQLSTCNQMRMLALPASQRILHISWWPSLDFRQLRVSPVSWKKFEFWLHLFVCFLVQQPHWDSTFHLQSNALHYYLPTQF